LSVLQRIILIIGTGLTIYFAAFAPFVTEETVVNPAYNPSSKSIFSGHQPQYLIEEATDYTKRFTYAGSSILGTAALFFAVKPTAKDKPKPTSEV